MGPWPGTTPLAEPIIRSEVELFTVREQEERLSASRALVVGPLLGGVGWTLLAGAVYALFRLLS